MVCLRSLLFNANVEKSWFHNFANLNPNYSEKLEVMTSDDFVRHRRDTPHDHGLAGKFHQPWKTGKIGGGTWARRSPRSVICRKWTIELCKASFSGAFRPLPGHCPTKYIAKNSP